MSVIENDEVPYERVDLRVLGPLRVEYDEVPAERVEVRVLGPLRARRADGTVVQPADWRTAQTADLLRLLALRVDEPVAVEVLIEALWPRVDEKRGRASLRTAASRIRKALGEDCVQRRLGGLVLTGAWVDAHAFRTLAHEARRHVVTGALAKAVTTTREAEALYLGEFRSHNDSADWGLRERDALAATFRTMIADAAEAAAALTWWHDTVDLAERTLLVEPCSERAYRALMRGQRGLGETPLALKTYDRCRRVLADEVGADPSAETRALHLELLTDEPVVLAPAPFSGRAHEQDWLRELAETSAATREPTLVCLLGDAGSGKTRLVEGVLPVDGSSLNTISCSPDADPWPALLAAIGADMDGPRAKERLVLVPRHGPVTVLVDDVHLLSAPAVERLADGLASLRGPACVVLAARPSLDDGRAQRLVASMGGRASLLTLPPLAPDEVAELCAGLLHGDASSQLTAEVVARTGGVPGAVVTLVREWTSGGRVAATSSGLVVLHGEVAGSPGTPVRRLLSQAVDHLSPAAMDVLHLVAVLGRPVTPELLLPLTADLRPRGTTDHEQWLRATLDHLADLTLITASDAGLGPRDPLLTDLVLTWLRPSARRRLHRRVAERAHISSAERVEHWLQAGEPQLARAASMDAAAEAVEEHQYERARIHLRRLCRTSEVNDAAPSDRVELYERWGDVAEVLGRTHEARAAFAAGASTARAHDLPDHERLEAKSKLAVDSHPGQSVRRDPPPPSGAPTAESAGSVGPITLPAQDPTVAWPAPVCSGVPTDQDDVALRMQRAVQDADERGDPDQRALARASLVRAVCIPQRKFRAARRWTKQALSLTVDPVICTEVLVGAWLAGVVLGDASAAEEALGRAAALLGEGYSDDSRPALAALRCLVAHDLGRREYPALHAAAAGEGVFDDPLGHQWVAIRVATERNDLAAATQADRVPTPTGASPVVRQLRGCASAALAMELGRPDQARTMLLEVLDVAQETGSTLLVPEAVARLIALDAYTDLASARRRFEHFDATVGSHTWLPRENVLKLIARAAIRAADGRPDDAASAAAAAADTAERAGLVLLAAQSHRHRAVHLSAAGNTFEARLAVAAAARWRRSAFPSAALPRTPVGDVVEFAGPRAPQRLRVRGLPANYPDTSAAPFAI